MKFYNRIVKENSWLFSRALPTEQATLSVVTYHNNECPQRKSYKSLDWCWWAAWKSCLVAPVADLYISKSARSL